MFLGFRPRLAAWGAWIGIALLACTAVGLRAQPAAELAHPRNPVARDSGVWTEASSKLDVLSFTRRGDFWGNFYDTYGITNAALWHAQHVVRLPNKDGRAYFMVSQSRSHNGYITVLRTDAGVLDPQTDLVVPKQTTGTDRYGMTWSGPIGSFVWQEVYTGPRNGVIHPHGNWNHPGKMEVIGGVLLVAAQNWRDHGAAGTSMDKVLFYDVRDPERPRYMGAITAQELGVKEVSTVGLVRTPTDEYLLTAGGDHSYATFWARSVSPDIRSWTQVSYSWSSGQHGMNFNSLQQATRTPGGPANGVERVMYFDAGADAHRGTFDFHDLAYDAASRRLLATGPARHVRAVPGADRDWDTSTLYVTKAGVPIIYTLRLAEGDDYQLYQLRQLQQR